jgi:thiol-disulfide isomerase/thioredoxin
MLNRRNAALAGAGVAALAAGAFWGLWRHRTSEPAEGSAGRFWEMEFETPSGARLATRALKGRPLVLNFWGTWCPPCVKEMPELDQFAKEFASSGWQVLGLAIDQAAAVRQFLERTPVGFPTALAGPEGLPLVRELGNPGGGLPFSVVFSARGEIVQRKLGPTDAAELRRWAQAAG